MAKVSKRVKKEEVQLPPIPSMTLTHHEHLMVETSPLAVENAKLLMAVEEQSLANMQLELKLLEAKIASQKAKVVECHNKYNNEKAKHALIIGQIIQNHGLNSEKFSYNNDTGEIIL